MGSVSHSSQSFRTLFINCIMLTFAIIASLAALSQANLVHVSGYNAPTQVFGMPYGAYGAGSYGGYGAYGGARTGYSSGHGAAPYAGYGGGLYNYPAYYGGSAGRVNSALVAPVDKDSSSAPATASVHIEDPLKRAQYYVPHTSYVLGYAGYGPAAYGSNAYGYNTHGVNYQAVKNVYPLAPASEHTAPVDIKTGYTSGNAYGNYYGGAGYGHNAAYAARSQY